MSGRSIIAALLLLVGAAALPAPARAAAPVPAQVSVDPAGALASFRPDLAIGAGLDGQSDGSVGQIYTSPNERAMASAGLGAISYRLRTELGVEAWHWSPDGSFSGGSSGYWTSTGAGPRYAASYGYRLPRRGDTHDQANDDGYSRLDDGSARSFWKSNPYLEAPFVPAGESHPQWVLIDLHHAQPLDAIRIAWGAPFATRFQVQRWTGPSAVILNNHPPGRWVPFPRASFAGSGGTQTLRLAAAPLRVRFVRVLMTSSSGTASRGSRDPRDSAGYAIRELYAGTLRGGRLHDLLVHSASQAQTDVYVSSTDPWHTAADRDPGVQQPSFTTVLGSGLTRGLPVLVPVPVLYGTPENAVAELRYLQRLGVPLRGVELGEEPDGQLFSPEDYGALYVEFAHAIHAAFPGLPLGGPGFQTSTPDWYAWPDAAGNTSWTGRFVAYLRAHGALGDLSFFSFEWYPFDNTCLPTGPQLQAAPHALDSIVAHQRADGLPPGVPLVISEYGYSAFAGQAEVDLPGALLNADVVARFLALGGQTAYLYGYEPVGLQREMARCDTWGNLTLLLSDDSRRVRQPVATYWAARMITQDWALPGDGLHTMLRTSVSGSDLLSAYAVLRPDGRTAILLLNRDPHRALRVTLSGIATGGDLYSFGPGRYRWHASGAAGRANPDLPPLHTAAPGTVVMAPYSLAVVRSP